MEIKRTRERDAQALAAVKSCTRNTEVGAPAARLADILPLLDLHRANGIRVLAAMAAEGLLHSARAKIAGAIKTERFYFLSAEAKAAFWTPYQELNTLRRKLRSAASSRRANAAKKAQRAERRVQVEAERRAKAEARAAQLAERRAEIDAARARQRAVRDANAKAKADARAAAKAAKALAAKADAAQAARLAKKKPGRLPVGARPGKRDAQAWRPTEAIACRPQPQPDPVIPPGLVIERAAKVSDYRHQATGPVVGGLKTAGIGRYLEPASGWVAAALRAAANDEQGRAAA